MPTNTPATDVQPGDFACVPISGGIGLGIEIGQWLLALAHGWPRTRARKMRPYDHAEIYIGEADANALYGYTISAYPGNDKPGRSGRRALPCPPAELPGAIWSSSLIPLTPAQRDGIVAWAQAHARVPYSFLGYLAIAAHALRLPIPGLRAYIARHAHLLCSQFCDADYAANGVHLFTDQRWPGYVDPLMLADLLLTLQAGAEPADA